MITWDDVMTGLTFEAEVGHTQALVYDHGTLLHTLTIEQCSDRDQTYMSLAQAIDAYALAEGR